MGRGWRAGTTVGLIVAATTLVVATVGGPARAKVYTSLSVADTFSVDLRGNGHGHGMSQYGAEGAAEKGLGYRQILAFYYPHTRLVTGSPTTIRVLISRRGSDITVAAQRGLRVSGMPGTLPTAGISRYRFVAGKRAGIGLYALHGKRWRAVRFGLPATTSIRRHGPVRVYLGDGTSTAYRQRVLAVRRSPRGATGLLAINDVGIDAYVAGVVPREMPASWSPAALRAQAVAARTYARYEAEHSGSSAYDICDTSSCQVYGGAAHYAADGTLLWTDDPAAVAGDENQYLNYRGAPIFAQFSASDGGWTTDGGMPYLTAHADPYDTEAAGNPYVDYTETVRSSDVAAYFGLAELTGVTVVARDGHGPWHGRVTTARITGRDAAGHTTTITTDGQNLQWAMGLGTDWLRIAPVHEPRGQLGSVTAGRHGVRVKGWAVDIDHAATPRRVRVSVDGRVATTFHTHMRRPRIVRHFALHYRRPGFSRVLKPGAGRHRICASVPDSDGLKARRLGCRTVRVPGSHSS